MTPSRTPPSIRRPPTPWFTLRVTDWRNGGWALFRFRAPTATELGSNFTTTPIGTTIFGNPNVLPETSRQLEVGATSRRRRRASISHFPEYQQPIQTVTLSSIGGVIQQYQNNPADIQAGAEFQLESDLIRSLQIPANASWRWSLFSNGYYNFKMTDYGAVRVAGSDSGDANQRVRGVDRTRFGQAGRKYRGTCSSLTCGTHDHNTEEAFRRSSSPTGPHHHGLQEGKLLGLEHAARWKRRAEAFGPSTTCST
jgi:vitamin B12 transporter